MLKIIRKVFDLLSRRERIHAVLLMVMILVMACLEVAGVASIMPFMAVLANPGIVKTNSYLARAYSAFGFTDTNQFLFFLGVAVFALFVFSTIFKALTTWALSRFTYMREYSLGRRLLAGYLHQPYEWFLDRNTSDLAKTVLSEVEKVVVGAIVPLMQLFAQLAAVIALLVLLVVVNPLLAVCVGLGFAAAYAAIYGVLQKRLGRLGSGRVEANRRRFEIVSEAFGGIKEIKVGGLEDAFLGRFDTPAYHIARHQAIAQEAIHLPRFALEILAFGGMLLVTLYLMKTSGGLSGALPILALYAFAGYRLLPAFQQTYLYISLLRFAGAALDALHRDLMALSVPDALAPAAPPPTLEQSIKLVDVHYSYPKSDRPALTNISIEIPGRTTVGLVGATGSGKTTMVDLILGLLLPQSGELRVDDAPITPENRGNWQRSIGYVPQQIFLADDSVAANIAFGDARSEIDLAAVEHAARIANLHEFVINDLPNGYDTAVGERGVRLSGGQRQRIGIARALYRRPQLLILDEATSALDTLTEKAVMEAVHNLRREITIILIAHRLSTVRECDRIYLLEHGRVTGLGTYDELASKNSRFQEMTKA